jgi:hypothetical protein
MAEIILWYLLLIAVSAGIVFVYAIADDLFDQWHKRRSTKKKTEMESRAATFPSVEANRAINPRLIDFTTVIRGYDSRDLFWEDALLRIDELKRRIAEDLKKEG